MTLRKKSIFINLTTLFVLLLLIDFSFTGFLRESASRADREKVERDLSRAVVSLNGEARTLSAISSAWAFSDATWNYMHGTNSGYEGTTLNRGALTQIGISSMILVNTDYMIKLFKDFSTAAEPSPPDAEFAAIVSQREEHTLFANLASEGTSGIAIKDNRPILYSVKPILKSDLSGPIAGYLIATRAVAPSLILNISRNISFNFNVEPFTVDEKKNKNSLPALEINETCIGATAMSARMLVRDHSGTPAFWVSGVFKKQDIAAAERKMQNLFLLFAAAALILVCFGDRVFKRTISDRISRTQHEMEALRDDAGRSTGITVDSASDEITSLQRTLNDIVAYHDYTTESKNKMDSLAMMVYERFSQAGNRLCYGTLENIATAFTPGDESFRTAIPRASRLLSSFYDYLGMNREERFYAGLGALFSRIGKLNLPFLLRNKPRESYNASELYTYCKYPIYSREILNAIELLRPATDIPYCWEEHWDGNGFPNALKGENIPLAARAFAIVDAWNELTRPWPGRVLPTREEAIARLRSYERTRLDPDLTEKFVKFISGEKA